MGGYFFRVFGKHVVANIQHIALSLLCWEKAKMS